MDKIFLDVNIFQDVLSLCTGFEASLHIIELVRSKKLKGYCAAFTIPTLWYLNRKSSHPREKIKTILKSFTLLPLTSTIVKTALAKPAFPDLEDELQYVGATRAGCQTILTRNITDFPKKPLVVTTPEAFLDGLARHVQIKLATLLC